jgi:hypothetical protein
MAYKVVSPIQHDGEVFVPGEEFSGDDKVVKELLAAGAIVEDKEAEEFVEPPPNYREPDLRLGSGDPSAGGAAVLAIDLPTPTNVPKPVEPAKAPDPGTLGITAPQRQVFEKMAERAAQEQEGPTLEEQQQKRDEEQEGAKTTEQQQGGEQDPKAAQEKAPKKAAPTPAKPGKELPSPAQAAAEGTQ